MFEPRNHICKQLIIIYKLELLLFLNMIQHINVLGNIVFCGITKSKVKITINLFLDFCIDFTDTLYLTVDGMKCKHKIVILVVH